MAETTSNSVGFGDSVVQIKGSSKRKAASHFECIKLVTVERDQHFRSRGKNRTSTMNSMFTHFSCEICCRRCSSKTAYMKHISKHFVLTKENKKKKITPVKFPPPLNSEIISYICHMCQQSFMLLSELENHLSTHTQLKCPVCFSLFWSFDLYKSHIGKHTQQEIVNYQAGKNNTQDTNDPMTNTLHPKVDDDTQYTCGFCQKTFTRLLDLENHTYSHDGNAPWKCPKCSHKFSSSVKYKEHYLLKHEYTRKPFFCKICNKAFANADGVRVHERGHMGLKPFICKVCNKEFTHRSNLTTHMATHSTERPWKCELCEKAFKIKGDLTKHVTVHQDVRNHPCYYCEKAFKRKSYLTRHLRTHTGEKPYVCDICNKTFGRKENCEDHRRTHTGERPHVCCDCGAAFADSGNLSNHKKLHNPNHKKRLRKQKQQQISELSSQDNNVDGAETNVTDGPETLVQKVSDGAEMCVQNVTDGAEMCVQNVADLSCQLDNNVFIDSENIGPVNQTITSESISNAVVLINESNVSSDATKTYLINNPESTSQNLTPSALTTVPSSVLTTEDLISYSNLNTVVQVLQQTDTGTYEVNYMDLSQFVLSVDATHQLVDEQQPQQQQQQQQVQVMDVSVDSHTQL